MNRSTSTNDKAITADSADTHLAGDYAPRVAEIGLTDVDRVIEAYKDESNAPDTLPDFLTWAPTAKGLSSSQKSLLKGMAAHARTRDSSAEGHLTNVKEYFEENPAALVGWATIFAWLLRKRAQHAPQDQARIAENLLSKAHATMEALSYHDGVALQEWAMIQKARGLTGDRGAPALHTARWLWRESLRLDAEHVHAWVSWAGLEIEEGYIGRPPQPEPFSARWLLMEGRVQGTKNHETMLPLLTSWATLETRLEKARDKLAWPGKASELYQAIVEMARDDQRRLAAAWRNWGLLEAFRENLGKIDERHSARWVFHEGTTRTRDAATFHAWGGVEHRAGNIGALSSPQEFTAVWLYQKAIELDPTMPHGYMGLATLYSEGGSSHEARELLKRAIQVCHASASRFDPAVPLTGLATLEKAAANWTEVARLLTAVAEIRRGQHDEKAESWLWAEVGHAHRKSGKMAAALEAYERAVAASPKNALAQSFLGHALLAIDERKRACEHLRLAFEIDGNNERFLKEYAEGLIAWANQERKAARWNKAEEILAEMVKIEKLDSSVKARTLTELGMIARRLGDSETEIGYLQAALRCEPGNAFTHSLLGHTLARVGRTQEARGHLWAALVVNPSDPRASRLYRGLTKDSAIDSGSPPR